MTTAYENHRTGPDLVADHQTFIVVRDGDAFIAIGPDFENLQVSTKYVFATTAEEAATGYIRRFQISVVRTSNANDSSGIWSGKDFVDIMNGRKRDGEADLEILMGGGEVETDFATYKLHTGVA